MVKEIEEMVLNTETGLEETEQQNIEEGSDASDPSRYAPQRRTAIPLIYQDFRSICNL